MTSASPPFESAALLFPGQGLHYVGMGRELAHTYPAARRLFEEADDTLGFSLSDLAWNGPLDTLTRTRHAQPAILTHSLAALAVLQEQGIVPTCAAGHSLGEWSALVAAGVLGFADAVRLVHLRGAFMEDALPVGKGGMAVLFGLELAVVEALCDEAKQDEVLEVATHNGPGHFVVAGHRAALDRLGVLAVERGGTAQTLQVSTPFHCALMAPAAERLADALRDVTFGVPRFPVRSTIRDTWLTSDAAIDWRALLAAQVTAPVLWAQAVSGLSDTGVTRGFAVGPGKSLLGMIKRITRRLSVSVKAEPADFA